MNPMFDDNGMLILRQSFEEVAKGSHKRKRIKYQREVEQILSNFEAGEKLTTSVLKEVGYKRALPTLLILQKDGFIDFRSSGKGRLGIIVIKKKILSQTR